MVTEPLVGLLVISVTTILSPSGSESFGRTLLVTGVFTGVELKSSTAIGGSLEGRMVNTTIAVSQSNSSVIVSQIS